MSSLKQVPAFCNLAWIDVESWEMMTCVYVLSRKNVALRSTFFNKYRALVGH